MDCSTSMRSHWLHALEFLLWGENASGNDTRPYDDFVEGTDPASTEAIPAVPLSNCREVGDVNF